MKLALLGADDESLALVRWAVRSGQHDLVSAFDVGPRAMDVRAIAPHVRLNEDWESLVLGSAVDAVIVARAGAGLANETGIPDDERRADQLRKLAQAAVPMLVVCPACEAIVGFEIEMIRRDAKGVIIPFVPNLGHPAMAQLRALIDAGDAPPIGQVEQITFERQDVHRDRAAVLLQLARDVALLRELIGNIRSVNATGPAHPVGRDPLGPKSKEPISLANLSVHLGGESELAARWSIGPVVDRPGGSLSLVGSRGKAVLRLSPTEPPALDFPLAGGTFRPTMPEQNDAELAFTRLENAMRESNENETDSAWHNACRDQEVAEAVDRSLARGRTIELFNEEHTEEESFKGVMAVGGCLLLMMALGVVFVATIVEGLRLPMRDWAVWQPWPIYLLVPLVVFVLLQLLRVVVKREESDLRRLIRGDEPGS